jgi:drug/metabolite transporter (DMT)-like permease
MVFSSACFAIMALAAKLAADGLSGGQLAFARFAFMMLPVVLVPPLARKAVTFQRLDLLLYRGIFGGSAVLLYFLALDHMPVGIATLLNYSSPIFSVAFAALFLGERVDGRLALPMIAALSGMVLAAGGGAGDGGRGELLRFGLWEALGMASAVLAGAAVTAIRAARRTEGSWAIYGSFSLFGLLASAPFGLDEFGAGGLARITSREWLLLAVVGASSIVAQLVMTYAYRWVTNLQAGVINQLTVVLTLLLGVVFLGDRLTPVQSAGSLLTLAGVVGVVAVQSTPRAVE